MSAFLVLTDWLLPAAQAFLEFHFLARCTDTPLKLSRYALFTLPFYPLVCLSYFLQSGRLELFLHLLLLWAAGCLFFSLKWQAALFPAFSCLIIMQLSSGIMNSVQGLTSPLLNVPALLPLIPVLAMLFRLITLLLAALFFHLAAAFLPFHNMRFVPCAFPFLLPLLLILFSGKYISDTLYGNTITIDRQGRLLGADHLQTLLFQFLSLACFFCILYACRKLLESFEAQKKLALLKQETQRQRAYAAEAGARYRQTRAFRHDIKNHLTVLKGLLLRGETQKAAVYLEQLDDASSRLSFPCQTGRPALDILLESKLGTAEREHIRVDCRLPLPPGGESDDLDLCIILSNALDNALNACRLMPDGKNRWLRLEGRTQGRFLMIEVENSRPASDGPFVPGTGLSNIEEAAARHSGAVHTFPQQDRFRLSVLFLLTGQEG